MNAFKYTHIYISSFHIYVISFVCSDKRVLDKLLAEIRDLHSIATLSYSKQAMIKIDYLNQ